MIEIITTFLILIALTPLAIWLDKEGGGIDMTTVKELHVWFNDDSYLLVTGKEAEDATIDLLKYAMRGTPLFVSLAENKYYASTSISTFKVVEEEQ